MRYIKLYEEFGHDEVQDVMMSICEDASFWESELYPSSERIRVYETDKAVDFDPMRYEDYLDGWSIINLKKSDVDKSEVVFVKGDLEDALLSWLKEVYGKLEREDDDEYDTVSRVDDKGKVIFYYYRKDHYTVPVKVFVSYLGIWSFFQNLMLLKDIAFRQDQIKDLIKVWLADTYDLEGVEPEKRIF